MLATKIDFSKCNAKRVKRETLLVVTQNQILP